MGAARACLGLTVACSVAIGTRGAETVYKFTTIQEKECSEDQDGTLVSTVIGQYDQALTAAGCGRAAASLYLRNVLRRRRSRHSVPERRAAAVGAEVNGAGQSLCKRWGVHETPDRYERRSWNRGHR